MEKAQKLRNSICSQLRGRETLMDLKKETNLPTMTCTVVKYMRRVQKKNSATCSQLKRKRLGREHWKTCQAITDKNLPKTMTVRKQ